MDGNNEFFENFERNKYLKNLPSMQRVKFSPVAVAPLYLDSLPPKSPAQQVITEKNLHNTNGKALQS